MKAACLRLWVLLIVVTSMVLMVGCKKQEPTMSNPRLAAAAEEIQQKWGMSVNELPTVELICISPHNENIQYEFAMAFSAYHALEYGEVVGFQWRDVGGGSNSILQYLRNYYSRAESSGIDVLFGGGEYPFQCLAEEKLLEPLTLAQDVLDNIPAEFSGMYMYDKDHLWCGNVLSGFGFIYNKKQLAQLKMTAPTQWEDLGAAQWHNLIILADPTQSGSAAATYEMVIQSAQTWPEGWQRLMMILSNAKKFTDSASTAANAPVLGEALLSTCIDFYGMMRVAKNPEELHYVSPAGQTGYTPDPIGVLKNPPHKELAERFVGFMLSEAGQALWALPAGHPAGPLKDRLNRSPIRKDVYERYSDAFPEWIQSPYASGSELKLDAELRETRYGVLSQLVRCAAIDNRDLMQKAKERLIEKDMNPTLLATFSKLPENVMTTEQISIIAEQLKEPQAAEKIVSGWSQFFQSQYKQVLE